MGRLKYKDLLGEPVDLVGSYGATIERSFIAGIDRTKGITFIGIDSGEETVCLNKSSVRNTRSESYYNKRFNAYVRRIRKGTVSITEINDMMEKEGKRFGGGGGGMRCAFK